MASRSAPKSWPVPNRRSASAAPSRCRRMRSPHGVPPESAAGRSTPNGSSAWPPTQTLALEPPPVAPRKASEIALEVLTEAVPELVLGSADLTPSNNTRTKNLTDVAPGSYGGRYLHSGARWHGMASAMNGIALHGGFIACGATFLVFSDYARPSMRLAALMGLPLGFLRTPNSIRLGGGGPPHPA